ncbi:MAG: hypothetical protein ACRD41_06245, partial [Candidatus Acidiferrales bacterium]
MERKIRLKSSPQSPGARGLEKPGSNLGAPIRAAFYACLKGKYKRGAAGPGEFPGFSIEKLQSPQGPAFLDTRRSLLLRFQSNGAERATMAAAPAGSSG